MPDRGTSERPPRVPPRWFVRFFWTAHRFVYKDTGGRLGLRRARPDRWGMLRLRTIGRRTGKERSVILGYLDDGPNMVLVAMNGWADPDPAWWLNLQAHPEAVADLRGERREVTARRATEEERSRMWTRLLGPHGDAYAALRSRETAVVILEPR